MSGFPVCLFASPYEAKHRSKPRDIRRVNGNGSMEAPKNVASECGLALSPNRVDLGSRPVRLLFQLPKAAAPGSRNKVVDGERQQNNLNSSDLQHLISISCFLFLSFLPLMYLPSSVFAQRARLLRSWERSKALLGATRSSS